MKKLVTLLFLLLSIGCAEGVKNHNDVISDYYQNDGTLQNIISFESFFLVANHTGVLHVYEFDGENGVKLVSSNSFPGFITSAVKVNGNEIVIHSERSLYRVKTSDLLNSEELRPIKVKNSEKIDVLSVVNANGYIYALSRHGEMYRLNFKTDHLDEIPDIRILSPVKMVVTGDIYISDKRDILHQYEVNNQGDLKQVAKHSVTTGMDEFVVEKNTLITKHGEHIWFLDLSKKDRRMYQMYKAENAKNLNIFNGLLFYNSDGKTKAAPVESGLKKEFYPEIISDSAIKYVCDFHDQIIVGFVNSGVAVFDDLSMEKHLLNPMNNTMIPRWLWKKDNRLLIDTGQDYIWEALNNDPGDLVEFYPTIEVGQVSQVQDNKIVFKNGMNSIIVKDLNIQLQDHHLLEYGSSSVKFISRIGASDSSIVFGSSDVYRANKLHLYSLNADEKVFENSDSFVMGNNTEDVIYDVVMDDKTVYLTTLKSFLIFRIVNGKLNLTNEYVYPPNFYGARLCFIEDKKLVAVSSETETDYLLFEISEDLTIDLLNHRKFKSNQHTLTLTSDSHYLLSIIHFDRMTIEDITVPKQPKVVAEIPLSLFGKNVEMIDNKIFVNYLNGIRMYTLKGIN